MNASFFAGLALGILLIAVPLFLIAKPSQGPNLTSPNPAYLNALESTAPGSPADAAALQRVYDLFENYSAESIRAMATKVYAPTLFFRDGFKEKHSAEAIEAYMLHGVAPVRSCRFSFEEPVVQGGDYYLRWVMDLNLHRDAEDQVSRTIGLSHMRFNDAGQVIFQQDYWDPTDVLYGRVPVAGFIIDQVKKRL